MAEIRRGIGGEGGSERLPWLEPVEDEGAYHEAPAPGGRMKLILLLAAAIALLIVAIVMFTHWRARHADIGELIKAPAGPYKERPKDPGGLQVDGSGVVAERTGTGADINAPLDLAALPEQPVAGPGSNQPAAAPGPPASSKPPVATPRDINHNPPLPAPVIAAPQGPIVEPAAPPAAKPASGDANPVASGGGTIQLGALNSEAKAKSVWKSLSSRFAFLSPLTMSITPVKVGDDTLYRLRASGGDARNLCARLKVAGEACTVVN